ncbi:MAG: SPASM domain-containing protein [Deltaproteobacteria bacterium]|nr:MAG: SPASM domain-containing protein [Deltaproteobacteria bacterium]
MEFSLPIRIRWDVDFRGRSGRVKRIARRVAEASPLFVELHISGRRGLKEFPAIVAELQKAGCRISAHISLFPEAGAAPRRGYPVDFVWDIGRTAGFVPRLPDGATAVSFVPDDDSAEELPEVLSEFAECGISDLHLVNVNAVRSIAERGHVPVPAIGKLREAVAVTASRGTALEGKRLVVHDYFLWKALSDMYPGRTGERVEFTGCQAGTALAFVDWEGNVYPCDSLPIRLGNIEESAFIDVWESPARSRVVDSIRGTPWACDGCGEYRGCFGGCRGMGYLSAGSFDAPDPACPSAPRTDR